MIRPQMLPTEQWMQAVDAFQFSGRRANEAEYQYYRRLLLSLLTLLLQMPHNLWDFHPNEVKDLEKLTSSKLHTLYSLDDPAKTQLPSGPQKQRRLHLLALIRAFEKLSLDATRTLGALTTKQLHCPDADAYLIPVKQFDVDASRLTLPRGALSHHRVLPATVSGQKILPVIPPKSDTAPAATPAFGAALFSGFDLKSDTSDGPDFLCTGIDCTTYNQQLDQHLDGMQQQETLVTAWAELTVPPDVRERIVSSLIRSESLTTPALTITGTWHERHPAGNATNTGHVYDHAGRWILSFHKMQPYRLKQRYPERIDLDHEIPVLILNDRIIAFAICLDFCSNAPTNPFHALDVDLLIVPSFGNAQTETGHISGAGTLHSTLGTQVFVVQQPDPPDSDIAGSVLPPGSPSPKAFTRQQKPWQVYT